MFKVADRIQETSTTAGVGTYTLAGASVGYQAFNVLGANNQTSYFATDGTNWEVGIGTVLTAPNRLQRDTIFASSNAGAAVNWSGATTVFLRSSMPAAGIVAKRFLSKVVGGGAGTIVLTQDEQRRDVLKFTGALTGNRVIEVDATEWTWARIENATTGAFTLTFKVTGQTGFEVPQGASVEGICDGVDARPAATDLGGTISPAQIVANQNDYNPAGLGSASILRISADARRSITGIVPGRRLIIQNVGSFPIPFKYDDPASTAANRFLFACTLGGGQSMEILYDPLSARWRAKVLPEPLGTIKDFGTATMPEGFLAIDQNVSRATYAALFNEIGTAFGAGDGATTFGLFVGAGAALIAAGTGTHTESVAAANVTTANDTFTVDANTDKWVTGMPVVLTTTNTLPAPLALATTYYIVRNSSTTIKLATSLANAQNGSVIDLTTQGAGVHTLTYTLTARTLGQRLGEETHAMSSAELLAHTHSLGGSYLLFGTASVSAVLTQSGNTNGSTTGGNAAMNNMQPSAVVTRGIRYC